MGKVKPITVLHLSDMQFGKNHRFGVAVKPEGGNNPYDTLRERLILDLSNLSKDHGLAPDLMILTGDLAEEGKTPEFAGVLDLIVGLEKKLSLARDRLIVIPGNHDINRDACEAYFKDCSADDLTPVKPYWKKWRHYVQFFGTLYRDLPQRKFSESQPWTLFEIEALKVVVAGLNSTIAESHRDGGHYGSVSEPQCQWFAQQLRSYQEKEWLRIGAVHHNVVRNAELDDENLRDAKDLKRILGTHLNCVLHGHTHEADMSFWIDRNVPTLSTGSAAVNPEARPDEVPNQYQIIQFWPEHIARYSRAYDPRGQEWIPDARIREGEVAGWQTKQVQFQSVHAAFPHEQPSGALPPVEQREKKRDPSDTALRGERVDDFLSRIEQVCRLRERDAITERIDSHSGSYLRVATSEFGIATCYPVGALESSADSKAFERFLAVHERYLRADPGVKSIVVCGGDCSPEIAAESRDRGIRLVSFVEFQGLIDFSHYLVNQTRRLEQDPLYPPSLYVPQRVTVEAGFDRSESEDAVRSIRAMLTEPHGRLVLVLGDSGTGKTFLLRELARRMAGAQAGIVPVLVEMRSLEKGRTLDELIAQHLARHSVSTEIKRFRYMLKQGRIALLFDGFDELALRVTYANATQHLKTVIEAAESDGKVVVTSRTQHFLSDQQLKTVLRQQVDAVPGQRVLRLQPFDEPRIRAFLRKGLGNDANADARFDLIDRVKDLLGLSQNPRMLTFIADLPEQDLLAAKDEKGEISAASLYDKILGRWLKFEVARLTPEGAAPTFNEHDLLLAVTDLALRLWEKTDATATISELTEQAGKTLAKLEKASVDPDQAAFRLGSGTLLVRDGDEFAFIHQSVLEWLVARAAAEELRSTAAPEVLAVRKMSALMADFFRQRVPGEAIAWAQKTLGEPGARPGESANALLVLKRAHERIPTRGRTFAGKDLKGLDFSDQDLSGADLSGADLSGALLVGAKLEKARLRGARLISADLAGAHAARADLQAADLTRANLAGADLVGAMWDGAVLRQTKLIGAMITEAALTGAHDVFGAALPDAGPPQANVLSEASCNAVAWASDGRLLAIAAGAHVQLWDVDVGVCLTTLIGHYGGVTSLAFSPNGEVLASGSDDKTVRLWEVTSGRALRTLEGHGGWVWSVAFSPDGEVLASGSDDKTVRLWEVASGRALRTLEGHGHGVLSVAFSPNGAVLASGSDDNTVRLWEVASGRAVGTLEGHGHGVLSVAFSPNGAVLASGSDDKTVQLWEVASGRALRTLEGHGGAVLRVAFSPDGAVLASGSSDNTVRLWEVASGRALRTLEGHGGAVWSVAFSPDGAVLASGSSDNTARLWEVASGRALRTLESHGHGVWSVAFSPDGAVLASGSADSTARLWEVASGRALRTLEGHGGGVRSVAFSPDGAMLASGSADSTVRLWEVASGRALRTLESHRGGITSVAFSPDGAVLASGSADSTVRLWEVASGRALRTLESHRGGITSVAFSPDGAVLASGSADSTVRLWEVASGRARSTLEGHGGAVLSVAFSPDGAVLASGSADSTVRLWEVASGRALRTLEGHGNWVRSVAFSPDGAVLASGSADSTVRLWEVASGRALRTLEGHGNWVRSVAFSPDGAVLASGSDDNTVRLWEVASGRCFAILAHVGEGWVAFTPEGRYKLGGDLKGGFWHSIALCRFEPGELPNLRMADDEPFAALSGR